MGHNVVNLICGHRALRGGAGPAQGLKGKHHGPQFLPSAPVAALGWAFPPPIGFPPAQRPAAPRRARKWRCCRFPAQDGYGSIRIAQLLHASRLVESGGVMMVVPDDSASQAVSISSYRLNSIDRSGWIALLMTLNFFPLMPRRGN